MGIKENSFLMEKNWKANTGDMIHSRWKCLDKIYRCKTLLMGERMGVLNGTNFHPRDIDQTTMSPTMIVRVS